MKRISNQMMHRHQDGSLAWTGEAKAQIPAPTTPFSK